MLKQTFIVLLLFLGFHASAFSCIRDSIDTINIVLIKVTAIPKYSFDEILGNKYPSKGNKKKVNIPVEAKKPVVNFSKTRIKNTEPTINSDTDKSDTIKLDTFFKDSIKNAITDYQSKHKQTSPTADAEKNGLFFTGLILLIAGIIITLFFRSGLSLIIGIVMIVSGYYILLYSLLFMN